MPCFNSQTRNAARSKLLVRVSVAEWLKLAFTADYRGSTKIDVTANAQVSTAVVMTEEQRLELMARVKRIRESEQKRLT